MTRNADNSTRGFCEWDVLEFCADESASQSHTKRGAYVVWGQLELYVRRDHRGGDVSRQDPHYQS